MAKTEHEKWVSDFIHLLTNEGFMVVAKANHEIEFYLFSKDNDKDDFSEKASFYPKFVLNYDHLNDPLKAKTAITKQYDEWMDERISKWCKWYERGADVGHASEVFEDGNHIFAELEKAQEKISEFIEKHPYGEIQKE